MCIRRSLSFALLATAACVPPSRVEPAVAPAPEPAPASTPTQQPHETMLVYGVARLYADPSDKSSYLELDSGAAPTRVVEVLERGQDWSRVRSVTPRQAVALGLPAEVGTAVIDLEGWMLTTQLQPLVPRSVTDAPERTNTQSTTPTTVQVTVRAGALLRWPDGRVAGRASETHYFHAMASEVVADTPEGRLELRCHTRRAAPGIGVITGMLCTSIDEIDEQPVVPESGIALDSPPPVAEAVGMLDRDIIRRIVRAHISEIRYCYNQGLKQDPDLRGRVTINFVIQPDGFVGSAVVQENNVPDASVGVCITHAVMRWQFPKPQGGGNVIVTYPFNLEPG